MQSTLGSMLGVEMLIVVIYKVQQDQVTMIFFNIPQSSYHGVHYAKCILDITNGHV